MATVFHDRLFEPLGMTETTFPAATSDTIPEPFSHGYLYGSSSTMMYGSPPYTSEMEAEAKAGTLLPIDFTDVNHSFSFAAGAVISTADDLATWIKALGGGKVLNAECQRIWQDSAKIIDPANSNNDLAETMTAQEKKATRDAAAAARAARTWDEIFRR